MAMPERVDTDAADNVDQDIAVNIRNGASSSFSHNNSREQSKILQSRRQVRILAFTKIPAMGPWNCSFDGRLLVPGLANRRFHQA
jgi:hypothetical protein